TSLASSTELRSAAAGVEPSPTVDRSRTESSKERSDISEPQPTAVWPYSPGRRCGPTPSLFSGVDLQGWRDGVVGERGAGAGFRRGRIQPARARPRAARA